MKKFEIPDRFVNRHNGSTGEDVKSMLETVGYSSIESLISETIPAKIRMKDDLNISESLSEFEFIGHLNSIAKKNKIFKSYIGMGYYPTFTPQVIQRNILENPGWYTQYTPYQAEISQGRLEALLNYQTMVSDLTGLPLTNASLLDEGTAAAEAMQMLFALRKGEKKNANTFFVADNILPQTIDVIKTRGEAWGIDIIAGDINSFQQDDNVFGVLVQYPSVYGEINDYSNMFSANSVKGIFNAVAADLMSLLLLTPPGEFGADVVVGTTQRFGVPMGYGGPHAAYFATKEEFKRQIPGRVIGLSVDRHEKPALRMALQTREQHIKREKATSNICTAQVLLAIMASMYAVYHGPDQLKRIAGRVNSLTGLLYTGLKKLGFEIANETFFDTLAVKINTEKEIDAIRETAETKGVNFGYIFSGIITISLNEIVLIEDIKEILDIFVSAKEKTFTDSEFSELLNAEYNSIPEQLKRKSTFLTHPVFNSYHSETEMMRYIKRLENKDLSLTKSMIPLGSCTMKLNAVTEMLGVTWPEFANIHPFAPVDQTTGYKTLITELENELKAVTGFPAVSLQPNSGAQGEYTGLLVIRAYHHSRGDSHRNVILIPSSAHGTNPASAVMAGGKVVVVACDENGNIDINDLKIKAEENKENLSALMVTYPSTHGVFEEDIIEICEIVHKNGGQVYMDGANMNAQVGLTSPAIIGADVCHLNLHKTFTIPHGGGGPGMGPIAAALHLAPFMPGHTLIKTGGENAVKAVSSAPWGSAGILMISYAYIKMAGRFGIKNATEMAILNANYIRARLKDHFKILYVGRKGNVGHEMIVDMRSFKNTANIEVEDIAKRLMDYGFHAPTVSFPVPGTLMIEPTESESKAELDRFCDALISIKNEIEEIEQGIYDIEDNVLKNAPHTVEEVIATEWAHKYSREKAAFPLEWVRNDKFWPSVARVNNAYGDRNLICSCPPIEEYAAR